MARPRYQRGFVEETGKLIKKWKVHWYVWVTDGDGNEERRHRNRVIGRRPSKSTQLLSTSDAALPELTRAEAQAELDRIIRLEVGGVDPRRDSTMTFSDFFRGQWLPVRVSTWRNNTKETNLAVFETHIEPRWGRVKLDQIDAPSAATWLGELAKTYSPSLVSKARCYLKSVVTEAVELKYLPADPLRKLRKPKVVRKIDQTFLTPEQIHVLRDEMRGLRDRLILDILIATGMRPSELFALRWSDVMAGALYVDEGFTGGRMEEPKTVCSKAAVAVPPEIMADVEKWREESKPAIERDLMFPSETGTPIYCENWRKRILNAAAKRAGVRVTFQILRRTLATLSLASNIPLKSVQAQMRHANAQTTLNIYAKVVSDAQRDAAAGMFAIMRRPVKKE